MVDASQGVEAQTVANCYTALDLDVEVVPVLNKIDLPAADPGMRAARSARTSSGSMPPKSCARPRPAWAWRTSRGHRRPDCRRRRAIRTAPLKALIIDSWFDNYVGVVMLVRVVDGTLKPKDASC